MSVGQLEPVVDSLLGRTNLGSTIIKNAVGQAADCMSPTMPRLRTAGANYDDTPRIREIVMEYEKEH